MVIHGMGEQKPMDTIKNFAKAVWSGDTSAHKDKEKSSDWGHVWSKPDTRTGSLELRRLTTRESTPTGTYAEGVRQDFYELYWADLSGGSTLSNVQNWIWMLLFRNPFRNVPRRVMVAWILLWIVTLAILVLLIAAALPAPTPARAPLWPAQYELWLWNYPPFRWLAPIPDWILAGIVAVLGYVAHNLVVASFGRVVRYTRALPDNIAARKAIRERGLKLLEDLHREEYERIIVVGHSLGSLLAYDLVAYHWAARSAAYTIQKTSEEFEALCRLEELAGILEVEKQKTGTLRWNSQTWNDGIDRYREAQRQFCGLLRMRPKPAKKDDIDRRWLITDLVTVGSPLGHAEFLLAKNRTDLGERIAARELATCPPEREKLNYPEKASGDGLPLIDQPPKLFSFPTNTPGEWKLHHAAQFAAVRWTNIHDPAFLVGFGDIISAPAAPIFGGGIIDIDLRELRGQSRRFTHTRYWAEGRPGKETPRHLVELRTALDLIGNSKL